jgi:DNA modification methylase
MKHIDLYQGDALSVLKSLPDNSVDMCMTSPPYWGLRNYHVDGQIGLEKTYQEYIDHLMQILDEVKRVIRHTWWVNIADSYAKPGQGWGDTKTTNKNHTGSREREKPIRIDLPTKSLIGIPERFTLAMIDHGWIYRNDICWFKRNPMPESVKDRSTDCWEHVYFYAKNKKYYFEQQFEAANDWGTRDRSNFRNGTDDPMLKHHGFTDGNQAETGRNKRNMWDIPTSSNGYEHYAAYPEKLCETPILAGCPAQICNKCGKAREKIYDKKFIPQGDVSAVKNIKASNKGLDESNGWGDYPRGTNEVKEIGPTDCGCGAGFHPGTVLDPFAGTGTTGAVAKRLGRKSVLIELNPKYCQIIEKRIEKISVPMEFNL